MADAQGKFVAAEPLFEDLPRGWASTTLGQLGTWSGGGTPSKSEPAFWTNGTVPWVSAKDMKVDRLTDSEDHITPDAVAKSAAKYIPAESVLMVTRSGILAHTFPVAVTAREVTINQDLKALTPAIGCEANFVAWFLRSRNTQILKELSKDGTTVASIDSDQLKALRVPLPPTAEQRRIVSRIDELFSRIEAGERAIAAARAALKRYRKSILKAAVTGALTADWREERGRSGPQVEDPTGELPELPSDWAWETINQLTTHITSGSRDWKPFYDRGTSVFILAQNVRPGRLDLSTVQNVDPPVGDRDAKRSEVRLDDLLVTIVGANTGDVCRVPKGLERHYVCQSVALVRFADARLARYVELFLQDAGPGRDQIKRFIYGAGRPHLSFEQLRSIAVAIPPEDEREEIISRVEAELSRIQHSEEALNAQTRNARALKQSILKAAFEGRLVPQDANDEPAVDMLARIAGETPAPKAKTKAPA